MWTVTSVAPSFAADPMLGTATIVAAGIGPVAPHGRQFTRIKGGSPGWVKVEVYQPPGNKIDEAYYCFYDIKILEDDIGSSAPGHDPRYGRSSAHQAAMVNGEGGYHFFTGAAEPGAETLLGYDDRYGHEASETWTGAPRPPTDSEGNPLDPVRPPHRNPELVLQPHPLHGNSIAAGMRDEQFVRVELYGPRESGISVPVFLMITPGAGGGEVYPGVTPGKPGYEIQVDSFQPPGPSSVQPPAPGSWTRPLQPSTTNDPNEPVVEQDLLFDPPPQYAQRRWILRIPWRGKQLSSTYADMEVEAKIPNPSYVANIYGVDPHMLEEGCMQLRIGCVSEVTKVETYPWECDPMEMTRLKNQWFRRVKYEIHGGTTVTTPLDITLAFGAKVENGQQGRSGDDALLGLDFQPLAPGSHDVGYFENYFQDEAMILPVNPELLSDPGGEHDFSCWVVGEWPEDAQAPWIPTGESSPSEPNSVELKFRGYLGSIPQGPSPGDFDVENAERDTNETTRTQAVHFLNVVSDVDNDGAIDHSDDDNDLEEGANNAPGVNVNGFPEAGAVQGGTSPASDGNLRKFRVLFSKPTTGATYANHKLWIDANGGDVSKLHFWKDDKRQVLVPKLSSGDRWSIDLSQQSGAPLDL